MWKPIATAPNDREIMLFYKDWLGEKNMVISGHWAGGDPEFDYNASWEHSLGSGDADMWAELPAPPSQDEIP